MDLRSVRYFVAVAEELHFGRAAARLHMSQPPLSRCIKRLEADLGCVLLHRSPSGVALTPAGASLYQEALVLLAQADRMRTRVRAAAGAASLTVGFLADSATQLGPPLIETYRRRHPHVSVLVREADLGDPTAGLRAGLVDVALTRLPFDDTAISTRELRADPVGVLLRTDDPLATHPRLGVDDLRGRPWFRLPDNADPQWRAFWTPVEPVVAGPVVRTVTECLQSVLWNGAIGLIPRTHQLPDGLVAVPLVGAPVSRLVVAWATANRDPLVRSFARTAVDTHGVRDR